MIKSPADDSADRRKMFEALGIDQPAAPTGAEAYRIPSRVTPRPASHHQGPPWFAQEASAQQHFQYAASPVGHSPRTGWHERAALLGLWALVILGVLALSMRFMEETAPVVSANRQPSRVNATPAALPSALTAPMPSTDAFDDPLPPSPTPANPVPLPHTATAKVAAAAPAQTDPPRPAPVEASALPSLEKTATSPADKAGIAAPSAGCSDALSAMQLCSVRTGASP